MAQKYGKSLNLAQSFFDRGLGAELAGESVIKLRSTRDCDWLSEFLESDSRIGERCACDEAAFMR
jgi:hypothetical protein